MSIASLFEVIADKVHEKGYDKGELDFWNRFTNNGKRGNYYFAFQQTDFTGVTIPDGLVKPTTRVGSMFYNYAGTALPENLDLSVFTSTNEAMQASNMIAYASILEFDNTKLKLPVQKTYTNFADGADKVQKILGLKSDETTKWTYAFRGCTALTELTIDGVIGQNNFDVSSSKNLTVESLRNIIEALADKTTDTSSTTWKVTFGATNVAKLTDDEINIIYEKGWDYA